MRNQPEPSNFAAIKAPISQEALDQLFSSTSYFRKRGPTPCGFPNPCR